MTQIHGKDRPCQFPYLIPFIHLAFQVSNAVSGLESLMFLDISHNLIQSLDATRQLPRSLCFLKVSPGSLA